MADPRHPFLLLPTYTTAAKARRGGGPTGIHFPSRARQFQRIGPRIDRLELQFDRGSAHLQREVDGAAIEQVVVFETIGSVEEFYRTVERSGLQFLFDADGASVPADEDFYQDDGSDEIPESDRLPTKLYLILTDQHALREIIRLWNEYRRGGKAAFARGFKRWANVFHQLRDIRLWDTRDRADKDTRSYWNELLQEGVDLLRTELEVWYSSSDQRNHERAQELAQLLRATGSRILDEVDVPSIRYRGMLVDIPADEVGKILRGNTRGLSVAAQIMYFRPQVRAMASVAGVEAAPTTVQRPVATGEPVIALLDGVPLQNHALLANRLVIDDPAEYGSQMQARDRLHGTAMASIVLHGDLSGQSPSIPTRVLCHPILRPDATHAADPRPEVSPADKLLVDVIQIAVRRLFEGGSEGRPIGPGIRIIQLAIGDAKREFLREISPLARLIDWLSWKYKVVFVVPCGNLATIAQGIELQALRANFAALTASERAAQALRAIEHDTEARRILSPGESINSLTVGGVYADQSQFIAPGGRFELFPQNWPSPESRFGPGFLRGIKPDIVAASGRRLFQEKLGTTHQNATAVPILAVGSAPGVSCATPGGMSGALDQIKYTSGTSNSSALVSHAAAHAFEALVRLRATARARELLPQRFEAVLLKAMVVHSCRWPVSEGLESALNLDGDRVEIRQRRMQRLFGNGLLSTERVRGCTDERATFLAANDIRIDEGIRFEVPLPQAITGQELFRRLTITLAWLSPINCQHRDYRSTQLWFTAEHEVFSGGVAGVNWQASRRGTVQHLVWEGRRPIAYPAASTLGILVSCAKDAGASSDPIPFGLCVSIESAEDSGIRVYQELALRVASRVGVRAGT